MAESSLSYAKYTVLYIAFKLSKELNNLNVSYV